MLGLTGFSDMRDVQGEIKKGNEEAKLAYDMYAYHIKKYIGSFAAALNGVDALVFTAGVGENDALTRSLCTKDMEYLGVQLDEEKNNTRKKGIYEINKADARVKILVIPTNEELEIARQCHALLSK
jgi:acetate kinase